jgi:hypothetical protein
MDKNRTYEYAYANHQRKKDRELVISRHLFQHHILAHHGFTMRWMGTNIIRTVIAPAASWTVQTVPDYTTTESGWRPIVIGRKE